MATGFPPNVRKLIQSRALCECERCTANNPVDIHHRRPRGAGGSKDPLTNTAANGVLLCRCCHMDIESYRETALSNGWIVRQGRDPREVPVLYRGNRFAYLRIDGSIDYVEG